MQNTEYWIEKLNLKQHPEGGFYTEMYRSTEFIPKTVLPNRFENDHCFGTAIYFLLRSEDISAFHKIKSDELWFFHAGSAVEVVFLDQFGTHSYFIGSDFEKGESFQLVVPANTWFGAKVIQPNSYVLVSCTVSPGFEFQDFELGNRAELIHQFPESEKTIKLLTR